MTIQPDLRTPTEWAKLEDCLILDADGWNGRDAKPFDEPITQAEYERRRAISTCRYPASYDQAQIDRLAAKRAAEDASIAAAQPAGEHHTGSLNLTGEGNAPASPISDAAVEAAARRYYEILGWDWDDLSEAARDHEENLAVILGEFRQALEAAYPAIRQHVAEHIAAALDAVPGQVYPEYIFPPDGTSIDCQSARVMRFAYPAAANIAREIGGGQ